MTNTAKLPQSPYPTVEKPVVDKAETSSDIPTLITFPVLSNSFDSEK